VTYGQTDGQTNRITIAVSSVIRVTDNKDSTEMPEDAVAARKVYASKVVRRHSISFPYAYPNPHASVTVTGQRCVAVLGSNAWKTRMQL